MRQTLRIRKFSATPGAPTVTPQGTTGATSYSYKLVARVKGLPNALGVIIEASAKTDASTAGSTATGNATLSTSNFNRLTGITAPAGCDDGFDIFRTVGGATQGKIATIAAGVTTFDDTGFAADGSTAPSTNATGVGEWTPVDKLRDAYAQFGGTFVATIQLEGSVNGTDPVSEGAAQTAVGMLQVTKSYEMLRAKMTAYTSGAPTVDVSGRPS